MSDTQTNNGANNMTKITLTNDFHNTEARLIVKDHELGDEVEISASQYYRANRALCGMPDCRCGGTYGGEYYTYDDRDMYGDKVFFVGAMID
jgi:hypothetical protein